MSEMTSTRTLEQRVMALETLVAQLLAARPAAPVLPKACQDGTCGYDTYRAYNPGNERDLDHAAYHAAERLYEQHAQSCRSWETGRICRVCLSHERRLRA